jgi:arylsulfatase A-like enzyme
MKPLTRRDFLKVISALPVSWAGQSVLQPFSSVGRLAPDSDQPNILILVLDAFSAGHSSLYGYPRQTTPNMERFASRATVFHRHYAGGNFTSPGTASLLTGAYPWTHRVFQYLGSVDDISGGMNIFNLVNEHYHTFAYTHNPLAYVLLHQFQQSIRQLTPIADLCLANTSMLDRVFSGDYPTALEAENLLLRNYTFPSGSLLLSNFDTLRRYLVHYSLTRRYCQRFPRGIPRFSLEAPPGMIYFLLEDAFDWLERQLVESPKPFLGYVHLFPPHSPYVTRSEFADRFADGWTPVAKPDSAWHEGHSQTFLNQQRQMYDETILYADAELGRLVDFMQQRGLLENTYLVLTSDHGEIFERGILGHSTPVLYEPVIRVPLVVSSPGQMQRKDVFSPTGNVDILPTVAQIAGLPTPSLSEGEPLPLFDEALPSHDRAVYAIEAKQNPKQAVLRKATVALWKGPFKLIYAFGYEGQPESFELYNLENDPEELNNLYDVVDATSLALKEELLLKLDQVNRGRLS